MVAPILQAAKYIPASLSIKALEKFSPKFKNYFAKVAAYGLDTNRALDWLSERFQSEQSQDFEKGLENRASQQQLRPDEMAARSQIEGSKIPGKVLRTAASLGGGLIGAGEKSEPIPMESQQQPIPQQIPQNIFQHLTPMQKEAGVMPKTREEALKAHRAHKEKKKLYEQLREEFEQYYPPQASRQSGTGMSDAQLLEAMQNIFKM